MTLAVIVASRCCRRRGTSAGRLHAVLLAGAAPFQASTRAGCIQGSGRNCRRRDLSVCHLHIDAFRLHIVRRHRDQHGGHGGERQGRCPVLSVAPLDRHGDCGRERRGVAQRWSLQSGVTLTDTVVTEVSATARAQYLQVPADVTLTDKEVTDESDTAAAQHRQLLSDATLNQSGGHGKERHGLGPVRQIEGPMRD